MGAFGSAMPSVRRAGRPEYGVALIYRGNPRLVLLPFALSEKQGITIYTTT